MFIYTVNDTSMLCDVIRRVMRFDSNCILANCNIAKVQFPEVKKKNYI